MLSVYQFDKKHKKKLIDLLYKTYEIDGKRFAFIDMVVVIVITLAAALAFTVLFTLSTTNISERERELATIKVLGFFDREVHLYVNKENNTHIIWQNKL